MRCLRFIAAFLLIVLFLTAWAGSQEIVSDFSAAPLFSFLSWEKKALAADGGVVVKAANGQGGMGWSAKLDLSAFAERTPALTVTAGPGNQAKSIRITLSDEDGTAHEYVFNLGALAPGATATVTAEDGASLKEPCKVGKEGKQAGLDLARIVQYVITGDWTGTPVDLIFRKLELVAPTPQIVAQREKLQQRLAADAERQRKAEEQKAARIAELMKGAPHPADGPDVRHVALVAPDVLALFIQEKQFAASAQVPYEPQPGDQIKRKENESLLVVEDGKVQEAIKDVVVVRKGKELGDLAINANRIKPADTATGQDLSAETIGEPRAYRIVGIDDPNWTAPQSPASISWKRKPNSYRSLAHQIEVFLKLPRPLAEGKSYRIEFVGVNTRQASVEYRHEPAKVRSSAVHVSAIGFRPDDPFKRAFLSTWLGTGGAQAYAEGMKFAVLDDATGKAIFNGMTKRLISADAKESFKEGRNYSRTDVLGMDFGVLATPGRYRVYVEGVGCSYPFTIGDEVWTDAFRLSMKGLLHHRSGIALAPPLTDYVRPRPMHPADGFKVFASKGSELESGSQDGAFEMLMKQRTDTLLPDAWGGYMDAGDWDRNTNHPAAMWLLVDLYEMFPQRIGAVKLAVPPAEAQNAIPDVLDEVLWNLEMHRRLQTPDGGISGGIESTSHPRPGEASWQESLMVSAYAPDPRVSFIYAATGAKLSRALAASDKELSAAYAASSRKAWAWAVANLKEFSQRPGPQKSADAIENWRNLAAMELWLLTGDKAFHDDFAATTRLKTKPNDAMPQLRAIITYARLPDGKGDAALRDAARKWVIQSADTALAFGDGNAFGVTTSIPQLPPMGFVGYLSTPEMIGAVLPHAYLLTGDAKYLAGAVRACQFSAGANPDNQALSTGLGANPVRYPLHIDSQITAQPAPAGITVYGISDPAENYAFDNWAYTWYLQKMTPAPRTWPANEMYWDIGIVPSSNEYTIHQTMIPTAYYWGFLAARLATR